jgi:hypothetical protein
MALVDLAGAEYAAATEGKEDVRRLEGGACVYACVCVCVCCFCFNCDCGFVSDCR